MTTWPKTGDRRVTHYRETGETLPPEPYAPPNFNVPTWHVLTDGRESLDETLEQIKKSYYWFLGRLLIPEWFTLSSLPATCKNRDA